MVIKIISSLALFVAGFFVLFQYPETAVVFFPLIIVLILGIYMLINAETAVLFGILVFFTVLGVLGQLKMLDRIHVAGGLLSMILAVISTYWFESRSAVQRKNAAKEIELLDNEITLQDREKSRNEQAAKSLDMRGVMQKQMETIVRNLAGTLDPAEIRKQMFVLVKEIIPEGKKYIVSGSANRDAADEWVMRQRVPILSRDVSTDGRFLAKKLPPAVKSLIVAPIIVHGQVEDILRIEHEEKNAYDLTDLRAVELITLMTSVSLGNARLYAMAESRAISDGLTGLFTQNYFIEQLQQELLFAQRYRTPIAVLMIDIDHFKSINDTHGHQAGDIVLQQIAAILRETTHPIGSVARYGGEEFAILLPQTGRIKARDIAATIVRMVEQTSFDTDDYKGIHLTVSIGSAVYPEDGLQATQIFGAADANLYRAKTGGRNRAIG